jgi:hypothetical protein
LKNTYRITYWKAKEKPLEGHKWNHHKSSNTKNGGDFPKRNIITDINDSGHIFYSSIEKPLGVRP